MRELIVTEAESGQRLIRLLSRYLNGAPDSFLYRMLRKKNIELNGKKAAGSERLATGDSVRLFLAEETIEKFRQPRKLPADSVEKAEGPEPVIVYEDRHVLLLDKPAGMLTQKAAENDFSLNDWILRYLLASGAVTQEQLERFRPSVCNRLDRNTSGLVAAGKTASGLAALSELIRTRQVQKYYSAIVAGNVVSSARLQAYLRKDAATNRVQIFSRFREGCTEIQTAYEPLSHNKAASLLRVKLITGRPHQIRAHLAYVGYPVLGDEKYGDAVENAWLRRTCGVKRQLLHARTLVFPCTAGALSGLSGRRFEAALPQDFVRVMAAKGLSEE